MGTALVAAARVVQILPGRNLVLLQHWDCGFRKRKGVLGASILHVQFHLYLSSKCAARGVKRLFSLRNILALAVVVGFCQSRFDDRHTSPRDSARPGSGVAANGWRVVTYKGKAPSDG
jgi:hypothetical protein